ncbi:hypothetical protein TZ01_01470 [Acidiplasma sp. MBA-1]|nr:hypothetical protein TZ01_01470 [Acidiplasma sp. MBA-1]
MVIIFKLRKIIPVFNFKKIEKYYPFYVEFHEKWDLGIILLKCYYAILPVIIITIIQYPTQCQMEKFKLYHRLMKNG